MKRSVALLSLLASHALAQNPAPKPKPIVAVCIKASAGGKPVPSAASTDEFSRRLIEDLRSAGWVVLELRDLKTADDEAVRRGARYLLRGTVTFNLMAVDGRVGIEAAHSVTALEAATRKVVSSSGGLLRFKQATSVFSADEGISKLVENTHGDVPQLVDTLRS